MRTYLIICFLGVCVLFFSCNEAPTSTENSPSAPSTTTDTSSATFPTATKVKPETETTPKAFYDSKSLYGEVMRIHDEAMAKMDDIYKLKKGIKGVLTKAGETENPEQIKGQIKERLDGLDMADEAMMAWMREFRQPKDKTDEEAMAYLQSEKVKIEKVSKVMNEAIGKAKEFLEGVK